MIFLAYLKTVLDFILWNTCIDPDTDEFLLTVIFKLKK